MPTTKSNSTAIIFSMFLWVSFGLSVISGLFTSFYMVNFDWYEKHLASLDQYFSITTRLLYYMEIVIFLIKELLPFLSNHSMGGRHTDDALD
ncbi:hypothetical protein [Paenibacillus radicis (ex Xue et al. 2023)]|uniref:Uncharacterized protein n=1 Tax=Paenibacillus radicis (ex Xue et al. 2023) TaxID=2972489 RepID=A0ABT1YQC7_9BACL|nr:hypothetical protein [Paenibacillus radicis (ex Xue et al. 2023)]MCR8635371.1 hypothetical protein [Paenibacillus radicis (ex Xue et al. 2023)]